MPQPPQPPPPPGPAAAPPPASPVPGELPAAKVPDSHPLALALFALTFVSGLVDAVSYLGLGRVFTANMTGNVVIVGFAVAGAPGFSAVSSLVSLGAFLIGAVCAGRISRRFAEQPRMQWFRSMLVAETVFQILAALLAWAFGHGLTPLHAAPRNVLIAVLALAMGLRNGTVRKLGVPDLTTTVFTTTLTGLAADSRLGGGRGVRSRRRALAPLTLAAGAALGAYLTDHQALWWPLALVAVLVAAIALLYREPSARPSATQAA